jgi:sugar lactone lactonase YvrE
MTVSLRAAHPSRLPISLAAVRSCFVLMLLAVFGGFAFGQSLTQGGHVNFVSTNIGSTATSTLTFNAPLTSVDIQSVTAVTEGASNKDFKVVSNTCIGPLHLPETCTMELSFSPTQIGVRLGALTITDTGGVIVNTIYLSGVGVGPQFVFAPTTAITTSTAAILTPTSSFTAGAAVLDGNGNLFFTDVQNNRILERSSTGVYSVVPTASIPTNSVPSGITIDGTGTLYVSSGSSVYAFMPGDATQGSLSFPSTPGVTLVTPTGLAVDTSGDLYIADSTQNLIYQVPLGGTSAVPLAITGATLLDPTGLAVDANNNLYVADSGHNRVVEIPLGSLISSVVSLTSLTLSDPTGVAIDAAGTIYIANTGGSDVIESTVTGAQFVLTETPNPLPLKTPAGIVIEANGDLVICDTTDGLIDVARSTPAVNFPTPTVVGTLDATDDPEDLTVQSSGNIVSDLTLSATNSNPSISTAAFLLGTAPTGACPILSAGGPVTPADAFNPGEVCTYAIDFQPTKVGLNSANLILATSAAAGTLTTSNTIPLTGIGLSTIASFKLVAIPAVIDKGGSVELILTALNTDGTTIATDYVGTVTFTTSDSTGLYLGGTGAGTHTTTYTFTAADNGVLTIPAASGLQLNQYGTFYAYANDFVQPIATSNPVQVVEPSTLTLTSSINPSLINQSTIFTLTVATTGSTTPGGTVTFYSDGVQIGSSVALTPTANPAVSIASISDSFAAAGNYAITATYTSTTNTQGGTASLTQVVGLPTAVTLTSSVNPSAVNQSTTLTANITAIATPTGTVTFYSGATALGTVNVTGTTASLPVSFPTTGTYILTAVYTSTNPNITGATSAQLTQTVRNLDTVVLTSSVNPTLLDNPTILTVVLTSTGPTPTGTVTFFDGTTPIGTGTLVNGSISISASFVYAGTHTITAFYSGDTNTAPETSPALSQTVADFSLTLASGGSSAGSAVASGTASYSLVVTPIITTTLPSAVSLTVTGLPSGVTDVLTPATIAGGSGTTPVALGVTAAQILAAIHSQQMPAHRSPARYVPVALALLALPLAWFRRHKRFSALFASVCLLLAITAGITGCISAASTGYYGETPQTYNLTVTATSGNLARSTYLTLTVQ